MILENVLHFYNSLLCNESRPFRIICRIIIHFRKNMTLATKMIQPCWLCISSTVTEAGHIVPRSHIFDPNNTFAGVPHVVVCKPAVFSLH